MLGSYKKNPKVKKKKKKNVDSVGLQPISSAFVVHVKAPKKFRKGRHGAHG